MNERRRYSGWPVLMLRLAVVALVAVAASCSDGSGKNEASLLGCGLPTSAAAPGNILANPGFEEGDGAPWYSKDGWGTHFTISDARAHSGNHSVFLRPRSGDSPPGETVRVYGAVQDTCPETFPELVRGYYYVESWRQGTPYQYLQFVTIVLKADNIPAEVASAENHQIRYILAGSQTQPTNISNARYVMLSNKQPKIGEWVPFEFHPRDDFEALWGDVPQGYDDVAFFFEARWDGRQPTDGVSAADVYYDDLYIGPEDGG